MIGFYLYLNLLLATMEAGFAGLILSLKVGYDIPSIVALIFFLEINFHNVISHWPKEQPCNTF